VLDPEQNNSFRDHYLDVPFDLSEVLFITTATCSTGAAALRDRMECWSCRLYRGREAQDLARAPGRQAGEEPRSHSEQVTFSDDALRTVIRGYTREAGVRNLEREIARSAAKWRGGAEGRDEG